MSRALADLAERRAAGELELRPPAPGDDRRRRPAPVAQAFFVDEGVRERYELDGILTLVGCVHAGRHARRSSGWPLRPRSVSPTACC